MGVEADTPLKENQEKKQRPRVGLQHLCRNRQNPDESCNICWYKEIWHPRRSGHHLEPRVASVDHSIQLFNSRSVIQRRCIFEHLPMMKCVLTTKAAEAAINGKFLMVGKWTASRPIFMNSFSSSVALVDTELDLDQTHTRFTSTWTGKLGSLFTSWGLCANSTGSSSSTNCLTYFGYWWFLSIIYVHCKTKEYIDCVDRDCCNCEMLYPKCPSERPEST